MDLLPLLAFVSIPACLFFLLWYRKAIQSSRFPPTAYAWQLVCNMSMSPLASLANLAQIYGPIFSLRVGALLIVVASSPETAKEILKARDHIFSGRYIPSLYYKIIPHMEQSSVLGSRECNDDWKYIRGMCHNWLFSNKAIKLRNEIRERKMMEMADYLRAKEGKIMTLRNIVFATLANSMSNMMVSRDLIDLGRECEGRNQRLMGFIEAIMLDVLGTPSVVDLFPTLEGLLGFWERRKATKLHQEFKSLWGKVIEERREEKCAGKAPYHDLLDALIDNGFCNDKICALLMVNLISPSIHLNIDPARFFATSMDDHDLDHIISPNRA
ncbi:probable (S)-N-methylcoclaurine 3'-hydroxylase isozyme 2 [Sesamum indicum]|uniref:Probable (S)-N-methylcoclaurine 3'-hydroxylase isozyme 2 n=1 Tax=Sesamum indicum TaxID=4182 RepID=A0A8M8US40_SESIN|nr:probable (S)-N-methylcoclaurine 3'-hydroxylase isozyme 2 [Sesamum indicum]